MKKNNGYWCKILCLRDILTNFYLGEDLYETFRILSRKPWMLFCFSLIMVDILFQTNNHMLGPKPFPLDRLMAVFYAIVEGKVAPTANIFMQVK